MFLFIVAVNLKLVVTTTVKLPVASSFTFYFGIHNLQI